MRAIWILIGAVCLLLIGIVLIGSLLPKRHVISLSAVYAEKPERLFALISGSQSWRSGVKQDSTETNAAGKLFYRETDRRGRTILYELFNVDPPRQMSRRIADKDLPYAGTWTYVLQPSGSGTKVTITEDGEIYNPAFRFLSRFVIGQTRTINTYLLELGRATGEHETHPEAGRGTRNVLPN